MVLLPSMFVGVPVSFSESRIESRLSGVFGGDLSNPVEISILPYSTIAKFTSREALWSLNADVWKPCYPLPKAFSLFGLMFGFPFQSQFLSTVHVYAHKQSGERSLIRTKGRLMENLATPHRFPSCLNLLSL